MLRECIETFNKIYEEKGERLITDSYELELGDYFIVKKDGSYEHVKIEKNSDKSSIEKYDYLAERDYYSKLLDMNKPIDVKKQIHSNNYLSFFVKNNVLSEKKDILDAVIEKYYEVLKKPLLKYSSGEKKRVYLDLEKKLGQSDIKKIGKNYKWIKENLFLLKNEIKEGKNYIKIFFDEEIEEYKKESKRYVIPNIYNSIDYNVLINDKTYGLPNDNLNLNPKKPYLSNKTRKQNYTVPYLLNEEEVFEQKKFFDYLYNLANNGMRNIYITDKKIIPLKNNEILNENLNGYFIRIRKDKSEAAIEKFEVIPRYEKEIYPKIVYLDYLYSKLPNKNYGNSINTINELGEYINNLFFYGKLYKLLNEDDLKSELNENKEIFYKLLYKNDRQDFYKKYEKIFMKKIIEGLSKKEDDSKKRYLGIERFNFMLSVEDSIISKGGESIMTRFENIRKKLEDTFKKGEGIIETDDEFYFAVGQLIDYFHYLNRKTVKTHNFLNPIIKVRTLEGLYTKLQEMLVKYDYAMLKIDEKKEKGKREKSEILIEMIWNYLPKSSKIDIKSIISGYFSKTLIYEKTDKKEKEEN